MSEIEKQYDGFIAEFEKNLGKVDLSLALKTLYLQKKLPDVTPKVELYVCYRPGTDLEKKRIELDKKFACLSSTFFTEKSKVPNCERILKVECLTDLKTIFEVSKDEDIDSITGEASLGSY